MDTSVIMPTFSVIIPTYNSLSLLKRALNSVLTQKDVDFEVIVVDDSTNGNIEIYLRDLKEQRIVYIHNQPSLGAVQNWNYGLSLASGKYVVLLHHDECFYDQYYHLSKCLSKLENSYEIIVSNVRVHFVNGVTRDLLIPRFLKNKILNTIPSLLFFVNFIGPVSCIIFKRDLIENFDINLRWIVDIEWYYRLFKHRRSYSFKDLTVESIHGHSDQISLNIDLLAEREKDIKYLKEKYKKQKKVYICIWASAILCYFKIHFFKKMNFIWRNV